jgi:hypothetical protein
LEERKRMGKKTKRTDQIEGEKQKRGWEQALVWYGKD